MGTVNVTLGEDARLNLILGQQLENAVTSVVFDFSAWQTAYGSGTLALSVQRPGDDQPYAVTMTTSGTDATWNVSNLDTAYKGVGHIQLTYTVGSAIKKSVIYKFTVYESLGANGEYPSPGQTWQEEIEDELADVKQDLAEYEQIFTADVGESVSNWLDEHPEATTTVEDGSLTESKFADSLKLKAIKDYVTPEMYGAKGDGETDDATAIQNMFNAMQAGDCCAFTSKTYYVGREIVVNNSFLCITGGFGKDEYYPTIYSDITTGSIFKIKGVGCSVDNLAFTGLGRSNTSAAGITFDQDYAEADGNTDAAITNCTFLYLYNGVVVYGRNLLVDRCWFSALSYGVIWKQTQISTDLRGHEVTNCTFHSTTYGVVNEINNTLATKYLTIKNNTVNGGGVILFQGYDGNLVIKDNIVFIIPTVAGTGVCILLNKNAYSDSTTEKNVISGNVLKICGKQLTGIQISGGAKAVVSNNYIEKTARVGIYVTDTSSCDIVENVISESSSYAIQVTATASGSIIDNTLLNCSYAVSKGGAKEYGTKTENGYSTETGTVIAFQVPEGITIDSNTCIKTNNIVTASGRIYNMDVSAGQTYFFNIPSGYRPPTALWCSGYMEINGTKVPVFPKILTNGNVEFNYSQYSNTTQVYFYATYCVN